MTSLIELITGGFAALVDQARAENEAARRLEDTKRVLIQLAQRRPDDWQIIMELADPPFLTLEMNVPVDKVQSFQDALCEVYFNHKRRYGDTPFVVIEGSETSSHPVFDFEV